MLAQIITHTLFELVEHLCGPVAHAACIIHLVRIVEVITQPADVTSTEGFVELREERPTRFTGEMIHHVALATRTGTLHEFAVVTEEKSDEDPIAIR